MENEYYNALENYDSDYLSEEYIDNSLNDVVLPPRENVAAAPQQTQYVQQPVYVQPQQVVAQPIYTQPMYAQPVFAQPIYTQPIIMAPRTQQTYQQKKSQNYFPADELKPIRWHAHPVLVFFALILCFPVGLILLLCFTKWGVFPKIFITLFSLSCILAVYEVLAFYSVFNLPSLLSNLL